MKERNENCQLQRMLMLECLGNNLYLREHDVVYRR